MTSDPAAASGDRQISVPPGQDAGSATATRTDDIPASWDERTVLTTLLDYARDTVHAKCAGITEENARRAPLPGSPLMTISGLVSHLRWVEHGWVEVTLLGRERQSPWTDDDPDREWRIATEIPITQLLADYRVACDRHRELVAPLDLDTPSRGKLSWRTEPVTMRWILMHLIEETARHNGHIDILREMADGVTGM
jgi:uncharacterized damage-inducible protein DinB